MNTLLIEAFGGLAGDMLLAALLDLDDSRFRLDDLRALAADLVGDEARLSSERVWRGSLGGLHLDVRTAETDSMPHRHYSDLVELMRAAKLPATLVERSARVLWRLAEAEARVHDTTPDAIHFHEVGAVDTLIDVCGTLHALERLGVERVFATPPLVGSGTVRCAHGEMPVPAPAVAELLRGRETLLGGGGERLTPTAAALLVELTDQFATPPRFLARSIGYGAGTRDPREGPPNLARVQLGAPAEDQGSADPDAGDEAGPRRTSVWLLEVNLDDMSGQAIGHAVRAFREAGALEAWTQPVQMKKDRPGIVLTALCREGVRSALESAIFANTSSFGLRWTEVERSECGRAFVEVEVAGRRIRVKRRIRPGQREESAASARDLFPEDDDLAAAVRATGLDYDELRARAIAAVVELTSRG